MISHRKETGNRTGHRNRTDDRQGRYGLSTLSTRFRLLAMGFVLGAGLLSGCEREETLLDVDTPDGGVEVQRNIDNGKIDVEVED